MIGNSSSKEENKEIMGKYEIGTANDNGERLIEFCKIPPILQHVWRDKRIENKR